MNQKIRKTGFRQPTTRILRACNAYSSKLVWADDCQHREVVKPTNCLAEATGQFIAQSALRQIHFKNWRNTLLPRIALEASGHGQRDGVFFQRIFGVGKYGIDA
ncbi:hypothetical protein D3C86_1931320 [compost metagenome]|jgi:hypothetical protein